MSYSFCKAASFSTFLYDLRLWQPCTKHGHDGNQVPNKLLFRREAFTIHHDQFGMMSLTEGFKVFIAKAHQPITMRV